MPFRFKPRTIKLNTLLLAFVFLQLLFSSCLSRKKTDYFQVNKDSTGTGIDSVMMKSVFEPRIQINDELQIQVASINIEAAMFFNPKDNPDGITDENLITYLVDVNGEIEFPLIGKMKVLNMTTREVRDELRTKLEKYLQSPTIKVSYISYKVTVLGEVKLPGMYRASSEEFTITDALGLAGDLTIFGDRTKIMLIREENGKKAFNYIDLTKRDVFKSDLYYLHAGDVLYVPAGKGRLATADAFYRIAPLILSTLTLLTVVISLYNTN